MIYDVAGHLSDREGDFSTITFTHAELFGATHGSSPGFARMAGFRDVKDQLGNALFDYFHRVTVTLVPAPTVELISNSFTNRFAPPNPRPRPEPVVKPSRNAN